MVVTATMSNASYFRESGERNLADVVFDSCTFDNCRIRGGTFTNVEFLNARIWSCGLDQVALRDCKVDGLRMTLGDRRGGKTMPLIVYGVLAHRVTLSGTIGSLIWNRPGSLTHPVSHDDAVRVAEDFYANVDDFALDIRDAQFTTLPSLRYGPPGHLVLRDPDSQPLIHLEEARRVLATGDAGLGIWRIVLDDFVRMGWPESTILIQGARAPKKQRDKVAAELAYLRTVADLR